MQHAYRSMNHVLETILAAIALIPIEFDSPDDAGAIPAECFRVFWTNYGEPTEQPNRFEAFIDLAVRVPPVGQTPNMLLALQRTSAIDAALALDGQITGPTNPTRPPGPIAGGGYGRIGRFDFSTTPATYLSEMEVHGEGGWVPISTQSPGQVHLARTLRVTWRK